MQRVRNIRSGKCAVMAGYLIIGRCDAKFSAVSKDCVSGAFSCGPLGSPTADAEV
jgi:hypothetical protein